MRVSPSPRNRWNPVSLLVRRNALTRNSLDKRRTIGGVEPLPLAHQQPSSTVPRCRSTVNNRYGEHFA